MTLLQQVDLGYYGAPINEYARTQSMMQAMSIIVTKYRAGDYSDFGGDRTSMYQYIQQSAGDALYLIEMVGGSAPAMLNQWNALTEQMASVGIPLPVISRNVEVVGDTRSVYLSVGDAIIQSPSSSGEVDALSGKTISPIYDVPQQASITPLTSSIPTLLLLAAGAYFLFKRR